MRIRFYLKEVVNRMTKGIDARKFYQDTPVTFSPEIDATKLEKELKYQHHTKQ